MNATVTDPATSATVKAPSRRRTVRRVLAASALTLALAAGGGYLWLDQTAEVHNLGTTACATVTPSDPAAAQSIPEICDLLEQLTGAWSRADADAYGALFTEDATYTSYVGTYYTGRADITEGHRALFKGFLKGTRLADSILGIRFYGTDTAVVTSRGDTYKGDRKSQAELSKTQTYTIVRQDGRWRIAAFQNTQRKDVMERISFLYDPATKPAAER